MVLRSKIVEYYKVRDIRSFGLMEEIWFIFKGDHHLGPFSLEKVIAMYQAHELNENVLMWREGARPWTSFKDIPELAEALYAIQNPEHSDELPPDLPPMPFAASISTLEDAQDFQSKKEFIPNAKDFKSSHQDDPFHYLDDFMSNAEDLDVQVVTDHKQHDHLLSEDRPPSLPDLPEQEFNNHQYDKDFLDSRLLNERANIARNEERYDDSKHIFSNDIEKFESIEDNFDFPDIPDIPIDTAPQQVVEKGPPVFETSTKELMISDDLPNIPTFSTSLSNDQELLSDIDALENFQSNRFKQKEKIVQLMMCFLCFSMVILSLYMFYDSKPVKELFIGLSPKNYKRLSKYRVKATTGDLSKLKFEWSADRDTDLIWMAFNRKGPASLHLSLKSVPGKILSNENIVVTSQSKLFKGAALFNKFDIIKGDRFVNGHYELTLQIFDTSLGHKFYSFLKSLPIFKRLSFIQTLSGLKEIKKKLLIIKGTKAIFNEKLVKFREIRREKLLAPFKYQLESLTTLDTLLEKLVGIYSASQPKWRISKDVDQFLKTYAREVSPILQGIIIDFIKKKNRLRANQDMLHDSYLKVITFGKSIAALAADMIDKSKKNKKIQPKRQALLKKVFLDRTDQIKKEGNVLIKNLSQQINQM
jgi:hypothetical protein